MTWTIVNNRLLTMPRHRFSDTRQRIEAAAIQLFVEKGVAESTVRDIARAVDISEGALYRHFVSKEDLVWQLFERHYVEFAGRLWALAAGESSVRGKVAAMIRGFCRAHDENPELFRFLLFVQHGQLGKLGPETPTPVSVVRTVLNGAIASGEIPAQSADLATALIFGVVLQPVQFAAYGRLPSDMGSVSERLIAAAWAALTTV
jgi:AcrR family transcriptional regulator